MIGTRLGPYTIEALLGTGGMGTVYRAAGPDGVVALKIVHPALLGEGGARERLAREAELGRRVQHGNVVRTLGSGEADGALFLVMEYVEGRTLDKLREELGAVPEELCRHIASEVAQGLAAVHAAGAVHRDLKPANVLVARDNTVKLMDLGVARLRDEAARMSRTGAFVGSVDYAAPEQFEGASDLDGRTDLHALGVLLYELATGRHPFRRDSLQGTMGAILNAAPPPLDGKSSPFFHAVVGRLLQKQRADRFATAAELLDVLDRGEDGDWWRGQAGAPARQLSVARATALHGREKELDGMLGHFAAVRRGEGRVVLVDGETGIGKTRFVDEFVRRLREQAEPFEFLFGGYPPAGASPADALAGAFRERFSPAHLASAPSLLPAFEALLRGEPAPDGVTPLTIESLATCFVHAMRSLARERPLVLLVEDLHYAPDDARDIFTLLARAVPGHGVLLVGTTRPVGATGWLRDIAEMPHATHGMLGRLKPPHLYALLEESLGSARLAEELSEKVSVKSDGNPSFVLEILQALQDGPLRRREDGGWTTTEVIEELEIPSRVMDMITARIAGLSREDRELLDVASCCGFVFDPTLVAAVLGRGNIPALMSLGALERETRLVRSTGRDFRFDHHQVLEVLYRIQPERLREEYHAMIARALEERGGEPVELAGHHLKGQRFAEAAVHLPAALDHLAASYAPARAADFCERMLAPAGAVQGVERARLLLRLAVFLVSVGRAERQRAVCEEAEAVARESGDRELAARAAAALGRLCHQTGEYDEGVRVLERARDEARALENREIEARAGTTLGAIAMATGRYDDARAHQEASLSLAREAGSVSLELAALGNLGAVYHSEGRYEQACAQFELSIALAARSGDLRSEAKGHGNRGVGFFLLGRYEEAREALEKGLAQSREAGYRQGEANVSLNLGSVHSVLGAFEDARACQERALLLAREIGAKAIEANATGNLGNTLKAMGRLAPALDAFERRLDLFRDIGAREGEALSLVNLGSLYHTLGMPADARRSLLAGLELSRSIGSPRWEAWAAHNLGRLASAVDADDEAIAWHEAALAKHREMNAQRDETYSLLALAGLHARNGGAEQARDELAQATAIADESGDERSQVLARCLAARLGFHDAGDAAARLDAAGDRMHVLDRMDALFDLYRATGDAGRLARAGELLELVVEGAPPERRASMRAYSPLFRAVSDALKTGGD
ncbi:MAG: protein kinase domain-containing protein [Planctomycetota bacterium]|jgi:tetratricopeptide (TPR) repeat protein